METKDTQVPIASKELLDSVGDTYDTSVKNVFMIVCHRINSKGTGFLYEDGSIITNYHVIKDETPENIIFVSFDGKVRKIKSVIIDKEKDLAQLQPMDDLGIGLSMDFDTEIKPGMQVITWGYPLAYNGPAPVLSVGYVSGFIQKQNGTLHYIINGAFNSGNSGGPLLVAGTNNLIGVVVSKHAPITQFQKSALKALAENKSGLQFSTTDGQGKQINFAESQLVADFLGHMRDLTQVMLGEAIRRDSLRDFLPKNKLDS